MAIARLSTRYLDVLEEHGLALAAFTRDASAAAHRSPATPTDADRIAAEGNRLLASFEVVYRQGLALDDAMRAIGAIARAGMDTPKVRRTLREIADDQDRLAASERAACRHG